MHEWSLIRSLLGQVEGRARSHRAVSVRVVRLRVGELSGASAAALASAFEILREDTICREAELTIDASPALWVCGQCAGPIPSGGELRCPACGGSARLSSGDELVLSSIEIEVA